MKTYQSNGTKFKAHNKGCAECYRLDRRSGLIYPPVQLEDGKTVSWPEASVIMDRCAYCGTR